LCGLLFLYFGNDDEGGDDGDGDGDGDDSFTFVTYQSFAISRKIKYSAESVLK